MIGLIHWNIAERLKDKESIESILLMPHLSIYINKKNRYAGNYSNILH